MFRFLRRKPKGVPSELKAVFDRFLGGTAMAMALAEVVAEHAENIRSGAAPFPVLKADGVPSVQFWYHLRLEVCLGAVRFGDGSLFELADVGKQRQVFSEFLDEKAHLAFPQPTGNLISQSVQGMWQAYLQLGEAGAAVADPETDRFLLGGANKTILTDLEREASRSRRWFTEPSDEPMPQTLFGLFFDDLNRKTKSIAMSRLLGPYQLNASTEAIEDVRKTHGEKRAEEMQMLIAAIASSNNPDEAVLRTQHIPIAAYI